MFGELMACAEHGESIRDVHFIKGAGEVLALPGSHATAAGLCAIGYAIMEGAGEGHSYEAVLLKTAAMKGEGGPLVDRLSRMVTHVLVPDTKQASVGDVAKNLMVPAATRSLAFTPDLLQLVLGGSVLAGGTLGSLAYAAKRHTTVDDEKTEELRRRVKFYKQLSGELKSRIGTGGLNVAA